MGTEAKLHLPIHLPYILYSRVFLKIVRTTKVEMPLFFCFQGIPYFYPPCKETKITGIHNNMASKLYSVVLGLGCP